MDTLTHHRLPISYLVSSLMPDETPHTQDGGRSDGDKCWSGEKDGEEGKAGRVGRRMEEKGEGSEEITAWIRLEEMYLLVPR